MLSEIKKTTGVLLTVYVFLALASSVPAEPPQKGNGEQYRVADATRGQTAKGLGLGTNSMSFGTQSTGPVNPGLKDVLTGKQEGRNVKQSIYTEDSVVSSYGTEFQLVGKGSTNTMQEATYRFKDRNSKSLVAVDDSISSIRFYTLEEEKLDVPNVSEARKTVRRKNFLQSSEKTQLKGSLIGSNGDVSPILESYLNTVGGKKKEDVRNFLNLNGLVIPEDGVNIYQVKHHPKDWVYAEIRSKENFSFIAMDPAGAQATYDSSFSAPSCPTGASPCVANTSILLSKDGIGPGEPNSPNTIDSASDGTQTSQGYQSDESIENVSIRSLDHQVIGAGDQVEITTWYYCFGTGDVINIAYTSSTSSINWGIQNSQACQGSPGPFSRTVTFNLDNTDGYHAIRSLIEWNGDSTVVQGTSGYQDQDDLVFNVDGESPSINLDSPSNESVFNSGEVLKFSFSDPENHFDSVSYSLDGGPAQNLNTPYEIDTSAWSEGIHTLSVTANDTAGNQRTKTFEFTVDDTKPGIEILSPQNRLYATDSITLDYLATDPNLDQAFYSLNNGPNKSLSGSTGFIAQEGQNTLELYANDSAGNLNSTSISFEVDTQNPEVVLDSPLNKSDVEQGLFINLSVNEPNLENVTFRHNGGPNSTEFTGSYDIPTNRWPEKRFAGDRMIYVDTGTGQPVIQYPDGTEKTLSVSPSITGEMADLDDDSDPELPFIDSSGSLKIVDTLGETQTLASGLSASSEVIGVGDWKDTFEYVFYADPNDGNNIKRVRAGTAPETVLSGVPANSVLGPANFTADSDEELLFLGTSNSVKYIDGGTVQNTGFSSFGSNNQLGIGTPGDFDEDGQARVPFVDGANNLGLLDSTGATQILDSNYGQAVKTVPAGIDWAGDSREEILHVSSDSQRIYYMFLNGTAEMVQDSSGNPVTGLTSTGIQEGPDQRINNLRVFANDSNGRATEKYFEFNITRNNPPVILLDNPSNNSALQGDSIVNLTISDSNLLSKTYSLDGASNQSDFTGSNDVNLSISSEGLFTLDVYAEDDEGATASKTYDFEIDNTKPDLTVQSPQERVYGKTSIDLNYTTSDKNLESTYYSLNGGSNTSLSGNITLTVPEGENNLKVYSEDTAGNVREVKKTFTADITPPGITIVNPKNTTYFQRDIPAEARLDEEGSSCSYAVDTSANQSMTQEDPVNYSSTIKGLDYGTHNVEFWCEDVAGNTANSPELVFSNSKPEALFDPDLGAPFCQGGTSPCEVLENLIISKDDIATDEPNSPNTIDSATDGTSGTYQSDESIDQINITDLDAPTFASGHQVRVDMRYYCYGNQDTVNILFSENIGSPVWQYEASTGCSSGFRTLSTTFTLTGTGNVSVRGLIDYQNNVTAVSSAYGDQDDAVIPLDNFGPNIGLNSPQNNSIIREGDNLDFRVNDTRYENLGTVTFVNGSNQNYTLTAPYVLDTSGWSSGTQQVRIWANDTAGNYASKDFQFRIDGGPPTVSNLLEKQSGSEVSRIYVGETYQFSGLVNDDLQLEYSNISSNLSGSFQNNSLASGDPISGVQDYANFSFTLSSTGRDELGWKIWARDKAGYLNDSMVNSIEIWERISLFWEQPSGGTVVRGFEETFSCSLEETRGGDRISSYPVNFYLNNSSTTQKLAEVSTNINGVATYTWDSTGYALGDYTASCNVSADSSRQYSLEKGLGNTSFTLERDDRPQWRNQVQRYDEVSAKRSNRISAQGFDEEGLREAILATNESGIWDNKSSYGSPVSLSSSGTYEWTNFTWINQSAVGKTVGWRIYYRDSGQQYTSTPVQTFNVSPADVTPPQIDISSPGNASFQRQDFNFSATAGEQIRSWTYNLDRGANETVPPTQDYGLVFVNSSTSRMNILYRNGTLIDTAVTPSLISGTGDVDKDIRNEVVFVDGSGNLKALDRSGEVLTLATGLSTSKTPVAVSNWDSGQSYVFYSDPGDGDRIKKVREGEASRLVEGGISSNGVFGAGDLNADGDKDLVFLGSSSTVKYIEGGSIQSTGFSSFGTNNGIGLGEPVDADRDGIARIPYVDSSNNLGLLSRDGSTEVLNPNYGSSVKAPVTGLDVKGDSKFEVIHIDSNNRISLQYLDGSTETLLFDSSDFQAVKSKGVKAWRPYNPGRTQNFSRTGLAEGYHQVNFWANDTNGNTGFESLGFRVDRTPPVYRGLTDNVTDSIFQVDSAGINLQVRDDNSGIYRVKLATNESGIWENKSAYGSPITEPNISDNWVLESFTWRNSSFNGTLGYRAYIQDAAGNINESVTNSFRVKEVSNNFSASDLRFNRTDPVSGEDVGLKANISRGESTSKDQVDVNITVESFDGSSWNVIDYSLKTASPATGSEEILEYIWNANSGSYRFNYTVDPENTVSETSESDNTVSKTFNVSSYQIFFGGSEIKLELSSTEGSRMSAWLGKETNSTLYFTDVDASYTFTDLKPLNGSNDLSEADQALNLQGHEDSLEKIYSQSQTRCFLVGGRDVCDIPYINSTNTSSFQTGVMYDSADGNGFDSSQDLVFVTRVNSSERGRYGVYDYEISVPATTGEQIPSRDEVDVFSEIH